MQTDDIVNGEIYRTTVSSARRARAVSLVPQPRKTASSTYYMVVMQPLDADDQPLGDPIEVQTRQILERAS
jgi:hypothetical protein